MGSSAENYSPKVRFNFFKHWPKAGTRNRSAQIQARGLAKQAGRKPNTGTRQKPTKALATISQTPARMAKVLNPMPWMANRTTFTRVRGI